MNAFVTLLKREWLESKTSYLWLPVATLAILIGLSLVLLLISRFGEMDIQITTSGDASGSFLFGQWSEQDWQQRMYGLRRLVVAPFYLIYLAAAVFVLLGGLYDERRDRSVLFWKSLPVSDLSTVLSKLVLALWIAPVVLIVCAVAAQLVLLGVLGFYLSSNALGDAAQLWTHAGILSGAFHLILGFLIQGLWVLPIAAYLLLISVAVTRQPLLWALLVPVVPVVLEYALFGTRTIADAIARHMEPAALPNFTGDDERIMAVPYTSADQLGLLLEPDLWLGLGLGAALLYAAARLRGFQNEL